MVNISFQAAACTIIRYLVQVIYLCFADAHAIRIVRERVQYMQRKKFHLILFSFGLKLNGRAEEVMHLVLVEGGKKAERVSFCSHRNVQTLNFRGITTFVLFFKIIVSHFEFSRAKNICPSFKRLLRRLFKICFYFCIITF